MGSRCVRTRMNIEGDRLSSLPDDLIHKILSFIDIKHAVETSALSSRWRYTWTSMPCLHFSNEDFLSPAKLFAFVTRVMSGRNNQIEVSSLKFTFHRKLIHANVKRILNVILNYESTHNVRQLKFKNRSCGKMESPLYLLSGCTYVHLITTKPTRELLNLATLNLYQVTFCDDCDGLFSNFANLKNLTLTECRMEDGSKGFNIFHSRLSNLTLERGHESCSVVTPQLKNLTIRRWGELLMISAPDLASLHYEDNSCLQFSTELLHLEKVDLCFSYYSENKVKAENMVSLLSQLRSVKFLTLNLDLLKLLSSYVELISHQPSPFANLKRLKIYPCDVTLHAEDKTQPEVPMSTEVKNYMLDGSPGVTFTMVSYEEIRVVKNVTLARNLMGELDVLLDQLKEDNEINATDMKQDNAPMESHMATMPEQVEVANQLDATMKWPFRGRMKHITEQFTKGKTYTGRLFPLLRKIEGILAKLPTSHQAKLQARFDNLSAEAEASINVIVNHL